MNPKRRFLVALAILVFVALGVCVLSSRERLKNEDLKKNVHPVFLRIERTNGVNQAVFRLDAPKSRNVYLLLTPNSTAIVSGTNRIPAQASPYQRFSYVTVVKAGAQEFRLIALKDKYSWSVFDDAWRLDVWRLEMDLFEPNWRRNGDYRLVGTIQSEPITNAMPKSTDSSR